MDDPLKPQLSYAEALSYLKERQADLDEREQDLARRHEALLVLEKAHTDKVESNKKELAELESQKRNSKADIAKLQLIADNKTAELRADGAKKLERIAELKRQIEGLEASYKLNFTRNGELAKSLRAKEVQLGEKRRELDELITYLKTQEKSVQEALDGYNQQLQSCNDNLADLNQRIAVQTDAVASVTAEAHHVRQQADTERTKLETELTNLEDKIKSTSDQLTDTLTELNQAQGDLARVQQEYDKVIADTEIQIKKALTERKASEQARSLLKKVERDASDERRRLQSDRAVFGRL